MNNKKYIDLTFEEIITIFGEESKELKGLLLNSENIEIISINDNYVDVKRFGMIDEYPLHHVVEVPLNKIRPIFDLSERPKKLCVSIMLKEGILLTEEFEFKNKKEDINWFNEAADTLGSYRNYENLSLKLETDDLFGSKSLDVLTDEIIAVQWEVK